MDKNGSIGIFDSGVGGLKILSALKNALPNENFIYVFDRSHSPYGKRSEKYVKNRASKISELLIGQNVKTIVIACNTATTVSISYLRNKFNVPFVGVEPPLKPALKSDKNNVLILCTQLTAKQPFLANLISNTDKHVKVLPCPFLATKIEKNISSLSDVKPYLYSLLDSVKDFNADAVVLGCTHYYFITNFINEYYSNNVKIYDSIDGVVCQTKRILQNNDIYSNINKGIVKYIYL